MGVVLFEALWRPQSSSRIPFTMTLHVLNP